MKSLSGVSKLAVLLLILVLPAVATAPTITVMPVTPMVVQAGPDSCRFDLYIAPVPGHPNNVKMITLANGSWILS